jgi:RNA polymerase sigma-70 factor (ECF subfamily)
VSDDRDRADVERVRAGQTEAYEAIVRRWQGPLVNLAWRWTADRTRAEELAHEAFVRAWRALPRWRGEGAFSTWLFAIAVNTYRSALRQHGPPPAPIEEALSIAGSDDPTETAERDSEDRRVRAIVMALPERYRDALVLYYFHGMDVEAAARSLRVPSGTLKAQLARGRELVRKQLERAEAAGSIRAADRALREVEA